MVLARTVGERELNSELLLKVAVFVNSRRAAGKEK